MDADKRDIGAEMDAWHDAAIARLRAWIAEDPRSIAEIAKVAGLYRTHVAAITKGDKMPNYRSIVALVFALGRRPADLDPDRPESSR